MIIPRSFFMVEDKVSQDIKEWGFRYKAAWTTHLEWKNFLATSWRIDGVLLGNLKNLNDRAKNWNNGVSRNIFFQKKKLLSRIVGIHTEGSRDVHNQILRCLELELREELECVLSREEILTTQKQGVDWVSFGDQNSSWFHSKWKRRNKRELVYGLKIDESKWCNN